MGLSAISGPIRHLWATRPFRGHSAISGPHCHIGAGSAIWGSLRHLGSIPLSWDTPPFRGHSAISRPLCHLRATLPSQARSVISLSRRHFAISGPLRHLRTLCNLGANCRNEPLCHLGATPPSRVHSAISIACSTCKSTKRLYIHSLCITTQHCAKTCNRSNCRFYSR